MIRGWGHACEIVAPIEIPRRPGEQRKHGGKDAEELARLYRAELVTIRVPTEREERVRRLVRAGGCFSARSSSRATTSSSSRRAAVWVPRAEDGRT